MQKSYRVIVSVTSDLVTDQRVHKACTTLHNNGYAVILVGRRLDNSMILEPRVYNTHRMKLWFEKGALFYANYNLRLLWFLLFHKADILLANDLDTLLPNYLTTKIKNITLVYDNHEYYTGVPELQGRPFVRNTWKAIERWIFPKLKYVYTVNSSIAQLYESEYKVPLKVVRNIPFLNTDSIESTLPKDFPSDKRVILYQGAGINMDRGVEELIQAMQYLDGVALLIVGGGDVINQLHQLVDNLGLHEKVIFTGKVPFQQLRAYAAHAKIGLTVDKDTNINYHFSLPNKVFDYIHAGLPILASRLPEIANIIDIYQVGAFIDNHDPKHIAHCIQHMLDNPTQLNIWRNNALKSAPELCWQNEERVLLSIFNEVNTELSAKS